MNENNTYALASAPSIRFQSTSSMQGSGSAYASNPTINSDGTAYAASTYAAAPSGPHRIAPPTPSGNPTPVGDAVWPLLFLGLLYTIRLIRKFNKTKNNIIQ